MSASRPTNTSRAYWELKAEQVMDRVFENAWHSTPAPMHTPQPQPIEVEVSEPRWPRRRPAWPLAVTAVASVSLLGVLGLWQGWNEARNDLRQERNLRLLEAIRSLETAPEPSRASGPAQHSDGLPPPPPHEPWIQELGQLESSAPAGVAPLQVPINSPLQTSAPAGAPVSAGDSAAPTSGASPELLGVVQIPGKPGAAIFQVGGSSTNALVGETIGSSGWRLVSTSGDSALIERGGLSRRVSISSGF